MSAIRQSGRLADRAFHTVNGIIMGVVVLVTLYPFWYVIVCSLSSITHVVTSTFILWPDGLHLDAYRQVFRNALIFTAYRNTVFITAVGTALSMALSILGAFVLSRRNIPGRKAMTLFVVLTMLFSGGLVPFYLTVNSLKLVNTIWALIIPSCISTYNMVILRNFFLSVPESLYESASIDGASLTAYLLKILLPLSTSAVATVTLFYAVSYWNAYFNSIIFIRDNTLWPIQTVLRQVLMTNEFTMLYDDAAHNLPSEMLKDAMIVVCALPIICVYPFLQKYFVKGVMIGSLKG